jgi:hypothetical protein
MEASATTEVAGRGPRRDGSRPREHRKQVPPATGFATADDSAAVPVRPEGRDRYIYYLSLADDRRPSSSPAAAAGASPSRTPMP